MAWSAVALRDGPHRMPFDLSHLVGDFAGFLALETDFDPKDAGDDAAVSGHAPMALELRADDAPTPVSNVRTSSFSTRQTPAKTGSS